MPHKERNYNKLKTYEVYILNPNTVNLKTDAEIINDFYNNSTLLYSINSNKNNKQEREEEFHLLNLYVISFYSIKFRRNDFVSVHEFTYHHIKQMCQIFKPFVAIWSHRIFTNDGGTHGHVTLNNVRH